jgi:hypothetical protein
MKNRKTTTIGSKIKSTTTISTSKLKISRRTMVRNYLIIPTLTGIVGLYFGRFSMTDIDISFGVTRDQKLTAQDSTEDKAVNIIDADGWKTMHVFYGSLDIMPTLNADDWKRTWMSQIGQDEIVFKMLGQQKGGYFIDLAANAPMWLSNSYSLETHHDWKGLCIEGNPYLLDGLSFRKCHVVGAVVSKNRLEKISYATRIAAGKSEAELGGIVGDGMDNLRSHENEMTVTKYTVPLLEIFEKFNAPKEVDYFSLDVEGAESLILSTFPWDSYSFKILTFERPKPDAISLLESHGYVCLKILASWGETLWAKRSAIPGLNLTVIGLSQELAMAPDFHGAC